MRQGLFSILLLCFWSATFAIDSPSITCISLTENDDIELTWSQPADTGIVFDGYRLYYRSGASQPFSASPLILDYNQLTTTINGSFAGQASFFIVTVSNGVESQPLDTVSPLIISMFNDARIVTISWSDFIGIETDSIYHIYKRIVGDTSWNLIGSKSFGNTSFKDTSDQCSAELEYKVEITSVSGCVNSSNTPSKLIVDNRAPVTNDMVYASVDTATGFVNVGWNLSPSGDVIGYLVLYYEDFVRSDTSFGKGNLDFTYSDYNINGLLKSETLSVAPFDSCFDTVSGWYNQAPSSGRMQTLFIDTSDLDRCAGEATLNWNSARNQMRVGVKNLHGFKVYRREGTQPGEVIGVLEPEDSTFTDIGLEIGKHYTYVVTAIDTFFGIEAMSNKVNVRFEAIKAPESLLLGSVHNDHETGLNHISFYTDSLSEVTSYRLFRSVDSTYKFQVVEKFDHENTSTYDVVDESGDADELSFFYQIKTYDDCDLFVSASNMIKSILIEGEKDHKENISDLSWSEYYASGSIDGLKAEYTLVRNSVSSRIEDIFSTKSELEYTDYLTSLPNLGGENCYYVEAVQETPNLLGIVDTFRSNKVCFDFSPRTFYPNAFSPDGDGINDVFLPYSNFVDQVAYHLVIYDRTGRVVFETTDPSQGWNGKDRGVGVYVYVLSLTNAYGDPFSYTGKVHLIR